MCVGCIGGCMYTYRYGGVVHVYECKDVEVGAVYVCSYVYVYL